MSSSKTVVTLLYIQNEDSTFDLDYYLTKHFPAATSIYQRYGLQSAVVTKIQTSPGVAIPPYSVQATMVFDSQGEDGLEGFRAAMADPDAKAMATDRENFTNTTAVVLFGSMVQESVFSA